MAVTLLPDAEALLISYLETHTSVTTLVSTRIHAELPSNPQFPLVLVFRAGGMALWPHHVDQASLQIDAYGRTWSEASQVARTVHAVLKEIPQSHSRGVVSSVADSLGLFRNPDPTYTPAKPRYTFGVIATIHPSS